MLTIKQITENTEAVLRGLEKKHLKKGDVIQWITSPSLKYFQLCNYASVAGTTETYTNYRKHRGGTPRTGKEAFQKCKGNDRSSDRS